MSTSTESLILRGSQAQAAVISPFLTVDDLAAARMGKLPSLEERMEEADRRVIAEWAEQGRADGFAAGYDEGREQGRLDAMAEAQTQAAFCLQALTAAAEQLLARDAVQLAEMDSTITAFAFSVLENMLDRELELATNPGLDALTRAIGLAPDRGPIVARLHPDDVAMLGELDGLAPGRTVDVVADASVERGGAVLDVGPCQVDAQLGSALDRVRATLRSTGDSTSDSTSDSRGADT